MATVDVHNQRVRSRNPDDPSRKLPVQPYVVTPIKGDDENTAGTDELSMDPKIDLSMEIDGMITIVKDYVRSSPGYSPTKNDFEHTMEAIELRAKQEEEKLLQEREAKAKAKAAKQAAQENASFMESFFLAFDFSPNEQAQDIQPSSIDSQQGAVIQNMLKRLVIDELELRRAKSATTIQSSARRILAGKRMRELRIIAAEHKRALVELAAKKKYDRSYGAGKAAVDKVDEDEVVGDIRTPSTKMKSLFKSLKKNKKSSGAAETPLLGTMNSLSAEQGDDDLPVQEKSRGKSRWWKNATSKMKKLLSNRKERNKSKQANQDGTKNQPTVILSQDSVTGSKKLALVAPEPAAPKPRRMSVTITTTDDTIPTPEAEQEAREYHEQQKLTRLALVTPNNESNCNESSPSSRNQFGNLDTMLVLADDATSITSDRTYHPHLDSWFRSCIIDESVLKEMDDDGIQDLIERSLASKELRKDLNLIPEMDWTKDEWADAADSVFRCSQAHFEEISFETRRFVSNDVTL